MHSIFCFLKDNQLKEKLFVLQTNGLELTNNYSLYLYF